MLSYHGAKNNFETEFESESVAIALADSRWVWLNACMGMRIAEHCILSSQYWGVHCTYRRLHHDQPFSACVYGSTGNLPNVF